MKKCGRPAKSASDSDNKRKIIDTTIDLIRTERIEFLTVRNICKKCDISIGTFYHYFKNKDELLMYFIKSELLFEENKEINESDPVEYVTSLYMRLITLYQNLGILFMKNFYSCSNTALSSYMGQANHTFSPDTIMYICEQQLKKYKADGIIHTDANPHEISEDICTIVKGCVFEWCICNGELDIEKTLRRIIRKYLHDYM